MNMLVIIPVHNQLEITKTCLAHLEHSERGLYQILIFDNGSKDPIDYGTVVPEYYERRDENIGVYPVFGEVLKDERLKDYEILAFLHNDLYVYDEKWASRVIEAFERDPLLGIVGFIGSNEIDSNGGRGLGTMSNFQGKVGGRAEVHGRRIAGLEPAAVVDGCAMIFRRKCLEEIYDPEFPPHHFYDRLFSLEALTRGYRLAVLGVACDHVSGQTANQEQGWHDAARRWCEHRGVPIPDGNADLGVYKEAERRFLAELAGRNVRVGADYSVRGL
jgi:GT2 family glycosyltransferase